MDLVVNRFPLRDLSFRIVDASENVLIEVFIPKSRIEGLDEGVLIGLSWRDEIVLDRSGVDPGSEGIGSELWAIVAPEKLWAPWKSRKMPRDLRP